MTTTVTLPKRLLKAVLPFVSRDQTREVLLHVALEVTPTTVALAACDTHTLGAIEVPVGRELWTVDVPRRRVPYRPAMEIKASAEVEGAPETATTFLLPVYLMQPVLMHGSLDDDLVFTFHDDRMTVESNGLTLALTRNTALTYPAWRRLLGNTTPEAPAERMSFNATLMRRVETAGRVLVCDQRHDKIGETQIIVTFTAPSSTSQPGMMKVAVRGCSYFRAVVMPMQLLNGE